MKLLNNSINYKNLYIFIIICGIILFPLIFFPLSGDLALFLSGAKMISAGYLPYKDIIDIKPPFLFYLVKAIGHIFGTGEQSFRIFDFIAQIFTCVLLYLLIFRVYKDKIASFSAGVMYSASYLILNYGNTTQIESFFGLCIIPIIYVQLYKKDKLIYFFLLAILIGIFTGLKYTLGLLIVAPFIDDIFINKMDTRYIFKKFIIMSLGFIIAFGGTLLPYLNKEILQGFYEMYSYFSYYGSHFKLNGELVSFILNNINTYLSSFIGFFIIAFITIAFSYFLKSFKSENEDSKFFTFSFIVFILVFITVLVERKAYYYHHSRVNTIYMLFAGIGFSLFFNFIKNNFNSKLKKAIIISLIVLMLPLSPVLRWLNLSTLPYKYLFNFPAYAQFYEGKSKDKFNVNYISHNNVANYINNQITENDKVVLAATGSAYINYLLNTNKLSKFTQSSYYIYPAASDKHINDFIKEISLAKYVIIQTNDIYPDVNGVSTSTYQSLMENKNISKAINQFLVTDSIIGNYIILRNNFYSAK